MTQDLGDLGAAFVPMLVDGSLNHLKIWVGDSLFSDGDGQINIGFLGSLFKSPKVPGWRVVEVIDNLLEAGINVKLHMFGDESDSPLCQESSGTVRK